MDDDDFTLLRAWAKGDEGAGNRLVRRHFATVYRFLRNKVEDEIDELAQATFLGCIESLPRFRGDASFRTYLLRIARNRLATHFRELRRDRRRDAEDVSVHQLIGGVGPSTMLAEDDERRVLLLALRKLPVDMQTTVELFYWEQLQVQEIADALEVPEGTVKSRLHRARGLLKEAMEEESVPSATTSRLTEDLDHWATQLRDFIDQQTPATP